MYTEGGRKGLATQGTYGDGYGGSMQEGFYATAAALKGLCIESLQPFLKLQLRTFQLRGRVNRRIA